MGHTDGNAMPGTTGEALSHANRMHSYGKTHTTKPEGMSEASETSNQTHAAGWERTWTMLSGTAVSVSSVTHGMLHLLAPDTTKDLIENLLWKRATSTVGLTCWDILDYLTPLMDVSYDEVNDLLYEMRNAGRIWTVPGWSDDIEYTVWERDWGKGGM